MRTWKVFAEPVTFTKNLLKQNVVATYAGGILNISIYAQQALKALNLT